MSNKKFLQNDHEDVEFFVDVHPTKENRFAIFRKDNNEMLDDCQGYGYKTKDAAHKAGWFKFSGGYKQFKK